MSLKETNLPLALNTSKDDLINNFFNPLLKKSVKYDRGVGFFSSSWLKDTMIGMIEFANNHGKARWITSPILSKSDWESINLGDVATRDEFVWSVLNSEFIRLKNDGKEDVLVLLAWLIADKIVEFRLAKPRNKLNNEFHEKVGIFSDSDGNSISFDGSINDSDHGFYNYESIKIFRSWDETAPYVAIEQENFQKIWDNNDPNIEVFEISSAILSKILKFRDNTIRPYIGPSWQTINDLVNDKPKTPSKPDSIILRNYQKNAVDAWFKNNCQGILEMATGTGKTITALTAITQVIENQKKLLTIILCPYIHLAQQWVEEAEKFGFNPLLVAESKSKWIEKIYNLCHDIQRGYIQFGLIVTTNSSFIEGTLLEILTKSQLWENVLIVADEAHHCGSKDMLNSLPDKVNYRLGLSATPIRGYDDEGTEGLISYFGNICFTFSLRDAINQGFLTPYTYSPIPVYMVENEFEEYIDLSKKLAKMHFGEKEQLNDAALRIAIKRARVLNNSVTKIEWIRNNISYSPELCLTLFYLGEKIFPEVLRILGFEKQLIVHEFTHRQSRLERVKLLEKFAAKKIQAFAAIKCLDEGVDVPPTETAYFLASSSVSREFVQRRGRVLRNYPGKKQANIIDLISVPPKGYLYKGKTDENYYSIRSAIRREYSRIVEFASLAENKNQALKNFIEIADRFDLLDL